MGPSLGLCEEEAAVNVLASRAVLVLAPRIEGSLLVVYPTANGSERTAL